MFKIALEDVVTFPVKLKFKQSAGNRQFDFKVTATRVDQERIKEELEQKEKPISDFLKTVVTGWHGQRLVLNDDNTPADFSEDSFDAMLNVAGSSFTIYQAYMKAVSPEKN